MTTLDWIAGLLSGHAMRTIDYDLAMCLLIFRQSSLKKENETVIRLDDFI